MDNSLLMDDKFPNVKSIFSRIYIPKTINGNVKDRKLHSCMLIEEGMYEYSFAGGEFTCGNGDVLYIPKGSEHHYRIITGGARCIQVEFDMTNGVLWSKHPVVVRNKSEADAIIRKVDEYYKGTAAKDYFAVMSLMYKLCRVLAEEFEDNFKPKSSIQKAVDYIEQHYFEKISLTKLAELCFMSQSQLRRKFSAEYNMSPITYKNRYTVDKAKTLLLHDVLTVGEISDALGFGNVYAFSAMFKRHTGLSPTQFKKNLKNSSITV